MIMATTTVTYYRNLVEVDGGNDEAPLDDVETRVSAINGVPADISLGTSTIDAGAAILRVGTDHRPEIGWQVKDESTGDLYVVDSVKRVGPLIKGWVANVSLLPISQQ